MIALNFNADRGREVQEYIFNVSPKIKIKDRKGSFAEGYRNGVGITGHLENI